MSELMMVPLLETQIGDRNVFNTGVSTVGRGGNDYFCGHCGRKMMHGMNLAAMQVEVVYQCGGCGGYNLAPDMGKAAAEDA